MFRNKSASSHNFAMVPRAEIPRASFNMQKAYKTTFNASLLIPVLVEEMLPGDTFNCRATMFCRMATPVVPIMDNLYLESFFFFVPNRLTWENWKRFMGEQDAPGDSISFTIPQVVTPVGGWPVNSIGDYMGLPTAGQVGAAATVSHSALPLRAYNQIFNEWFRDQNLYGPVPKNIDNGPDADTDYTLVQRGKRHDYFTSALPWVQKGNTSVSIPLGTTAPVISDGQGPTFQNAGGGWHGGLLKATPGGPGDVYITTAPGADVQMLWDETHLVTDLSTATAATINQLRQAFQIQKLLERDARGGTRYTEIVRAHFGVISPDARLQRPEYIGGGSTPVTINPIAQQSATDITGTQTPLGSLGAFGTALAHGHGFNYSATEHGYVIGLVNVRADLTYQQGLRRHWSRLTRYDFYFPAFAMLGEQSVLNKEIYVKGDANDALTFGFQERWAEYRYNPSEITGRFRSTSTTPLDVWHLAQNFIALPTLNSDFISDNVPMERVLAVGAEADGSHFIMDAFFNIKAARPLPLFSVPGLIDHF